MLGTEVQFARTMTEHADGGHRPLIVGIGGTLRQKSSSERALHRSLHFASLMGARTHAVTGTNLPSEIYDPSSQTRSAEAVRLVEMLRAADGVIVASPAYHGSISGHLKNAIDYTEDMRTDEAPYLDGRSVGLICCAMGWQAGGATLSAMRSITHSLRGWPTPMGVLVNTAVARFQTDNSCTDEAIDGQLKIMAGQVMEFALMRCQSRQSALIDAQ